MSDDTDYDPIKRPSHYVEGRQYEPIDVIEDWCTGWPVLVVFALGNVIKYVSRAGRKNDAIEDLEKAQFYLARAIWLLRKDKVSPESPRD